MRNPPALNKAVMKVPVTAQKSLRYFDAHVFSRNWKSLSNFMLAHAVCMIMCVLSAHHKQMN